jgi:hypothetical protein
MKRKEIRLLQELVRMGFDQEFSRVCDDFDMELLKEFSSVDLAELSSEFCQWNGDPENYEEDRIIRVGMKSVGRFLFNKLMRRIDINGLAGTR